VMEAFWRWLNTLNPPSGSKLAMAVTYAKNQRPYLENILKDGRVGLSTNLVENSIRPFTIGRKNFLFFDTPKGATAGQIIYSLVETAKANNVNPRLYLETILTHMPGYQNEPAGIEQLLPWSDFIVERCKG
ncbi:MAG: transposase, partial [Lachnospiraceae bacterium]